VPKRFPSCERSRHATWWPATSPSSARPPRLPPSHRRRRPEDGARTCGRRQRLSIRTARCPRRPLQRWQPRRRAPPLLPLARPAPPLLPLARPAPRPREPLARPAPRPREPLERVSPRRGSQRPLRGSRPRSRPRPPGPRSRRELGIGVVVVADVVALGVVGVLAECLAVLLGHLAALGRLLDGQGDTATLEVDVDDLHPQLLAGADHLLGRSTWCAAISEMWTRPSMPSPTWTKAPKGTSLVMRP